jgi:hypothetical protein
VAIEGVGEIKEEPLPPPVAFLSPEIPWSRHMSTRGEEQGAPRHQLIEDHLRSQRWVERGSLVTILV